MSFRSKLEVKLNDFLLTNKVEFGYETIKVPYSINFIYKPDFILSNGVILEAKGYWEPKDRRKIKAVKEQHPELDLRMVFQNPYNKISKKSKTTYGMWCDKHHILWTDYRNIPSTWLEINDNKQGRYSVP